MNQLALFAGSEPVVEPRITDEDRELAERLPRFVRLGPSSWTFPGWAGVAYLGTPSEGDLGRAGLGAFARNPLFRAAGLDRTYYAPLRTEDLAGYAAQLDHARALEPTPPRFRVVSKVWDELTSAVHPSHPRYGARAGQRNPHFLDADRFRTEVFAAYAEFAVHSGPFVFELTPMPPNTFDERTFVARVDDFLGRLPSGPRWAFELRNPELFGARWLDMLRANGAAHVFNYWTAMPSLRTQLRAGALTAPFTIVRLLMPPFTRYDRRAADLAPYAKRAQPQQEMQDDTVEILRAAAGRCKTAFVLVSNKAEGCAPETLRELARRTVRAF